jgi:hypothetical protein
MLSLNADMLYNFAFKYGRKVDNVLLESILKIEAKVSN